MVEIELVEHMQGLRSLQSALDRGGLVDFIELDADYKMIYDEPNGRKRFWYPKIVDGEVQVLVTFGLESGAYKGTDRYIVNYAVSEKYRGRGLAIEAVNTGVEDLKNRLKRFYLEALIDETNIHSIKVAKKLFPDAAAPTTDEASGKPALLFFKLIEC